LIGVVFSNGTLLLVSGKSESVNERTHTDQQNIKFHILSSRLKWRWVN